MVYQNGKAVAISKTSESSGLSQDIYSTEEQVVGRWIDGKPLYRRVSRAIAENDITVFGDVDKLVNMHGYAYYNATGYTYIPRLYTTSDYFTFNVDSGECILKVRGEYSGKEFCSVFEYTKITDEAIMSIEDSTFRINLQDTMSPTVMPVTTTLVEE